MATEGPSARGDEIASFWNIVLAHNVGFIVNLCRKCGNSNSWKDESAQYWPVVDDEVMEIKGSDIEVRHARHMYDTPKYHIRDLEVTKGTKSARVFHVHFAGWPDCGVPEQAGALKAFEHLITNTMETL